MFNESTGIKFIKCMLKFLFSIHNNRTSPGNRLSKRLTGKKYKPGPVSACL